MLMLNNFDDVALQFLVALSISIAHLPPDHSNMTNGVIAAEKNTSSLRRLRGSP